MAIVLVTTSTSYKFTMEGFLLWYMYITGESEASRLRAENNALVEELSQCKADKEFVWSLWKRLQVASPDLTQAVGLVMQRYCSIPI